MRAQLARARRYDEMLRSGKASSMRDLGRQEGITGARVCQLLTLLRLAPEIIERIDGGEGVGLSERRLRGVARLEREAQVRFLDEAALSVAPAGSKT